MKKTVFVIMIINIFSKFLGLVREVSLSYFFGANNVTDAYLISLTIPGVLFSFLGIALNTAYIPVCSHTMVEEGEEQVIKFTNNIVNILIVLCTIMVAITILFTAPIVKLFAAGFGGETLNLAVKFTRISIFGIYFSGLVYIFMSYLQIKNNFVIPASIAFPMNIIIIFSMFVASKTHNVYLLSVGSVAAFLAQLLFILPFVFKKGYKFYFIFNVEDKYLRNLLTTAFPAIIGASVNQINVLVDRTIASTVAEGGISALNYAGKLNTVVLGLFAIPISTAIFPLISKMVAESNYEGLKKTLSEAISATNFLVIPSTVGTMLFSTPIVEMLFGRGAFDERAVQMTSSALFFYSIGMIGYGLREVLAKAFYSMKDTKTPTTNSVIALLMNIILNIVLSKFLGIAGLALATSISGIVCTGLLFVSLRKKIGSFGLKEISISFIRIAIASVIMGAVAKVSYNMMIGIISKNLSLISSIIIGSMVYFVMALFMKIKEADEIVLKIKNVLRKGT
jgi:putative peptidoglycan lipid II flippase